MNKKNFKGTVLSNFIDMPDTDVSADTSVSEFGGKSRELTPGPVKPMKEIPAEKKERRVALMLRPSLYAELAEQAKRQNISVNELIHTILDEYIY